MSVATATTAATNTSSVTTTASASIMAVSSNSSANSKSTLLGISRWVAKTGVSGCAEPITSSISISATSSTFVLLYRQYIPPQIQKRQRKTAIPRPPSMAISISFDFVFFLLTGSVGRWVGGKVGEGIGAAVGDLVTRAVEIEEVSTAAPVLLETEVMKFDELKVVDVDDTKSSELEAEVVANDTVTSKSADQT